MGVAKVAVGSSVVPVEVEGAAGDGGLTVEQREQFLEYVRANPECSNREACEHVGILRKDVKDLRRADPEFAEDYKSARGYATEERIHQQAVKLAIEGVEEPLVSAGKLVRDEDGKVVTVRKYSERMLQTMFNAMTAEGKAAALGKLGLSIDGDVNVNVKVQPGVALADVARELLAAGVNLPELAAGDDVAGELVDVVDEPA